ncbi:2-oxoglutarate and iron-dependent oxygenase domain-containing protein [Ramlibacter sp.]|uniref:isopenicillin N synthase family dioxygenase n=1 Tax=Ramlibacter sp. TaxID=1917967 RepID=UPI002632E5EF|nr:2-oxoglutarate and iron-dependent oxygenase domain-containing protein [Ramlibacter sp.]MDB5956204.1 2OG-Fe(II) oxygenase [Ramlibacter sp.]
MSAAVPVLDLAPFLQGGPGERRAVAHSFGQAMEEAGFVTVIGHGVPQSLVHGTYRCMRDFFALPEPDKLRHTAPEQTKGRGYLPMKIESVAATLDGRTPPDLCEALVFASLQRERAGAGVPNLWPQQPPQLPVCVNAYFDAMLTLSRQLMQLAALALELPQDWFDAMYAQPALTLRFVNYPDQEQLPEPGQLRYGAHHDYGGLTILRQDHAPGGLQVCDRAGQWHDAPPHPGGLVLNVGDLMSRWTNGRWRSTLHRVINPPRDLTGSTQRLSMVAFTGPNAATEVSCLPTCTGPGNPARFEPVNAQAYVQAKLAASHAVD